MIGCEKIQGDKNIGDELYLLARQPTWHVLTYKGYEINGNTFYTVSQDKKSTNQNIGVCVDAMEPNGNIHTYYGRIEEIWELDYTHNFKVPLFRCQWVKMTRGGVSVDKEYGMTLVDLNNTGYRNDEKSTNEPKRHIVLPGKRNIMELKTSQTYQKIMKMINESHLSVWPKNKSYCSLLRTLYGYRMIITKDNM